MSVLSFGQIWPQFEWVIEDMRDGMCFFEGYVPSVDQSRLLQSFSDVASPSPEAFASSVWSNESTEADWAKCTTRSEFVQLFRAGSIVLLQFDYAPQVEDFDLNLRLILEPDTTKTSLEIICYREPILESARPREAVGAGIVEFRRLRDAFHGDALLIGPDTVNYPRTANDYPRARVAQD